MFTSEAQFVRWLRRVTVKRGVAPAAGGIGDDAAVVKLGRGHALILKTDLSLEGIHFLRDLHPPRAVGHRALARPLSDIAAMGGVPRYALISLAVPDSTPRAWIDDFYSGLAALARHFAVAVVGGDTSVGSDKIFIDVALAGAVRRGDAIYRGGARPGDQLFVSGRLGLSALGLHRLKGRAGAGPRGMALDSALQAHLYPEPRLALGRILGQAHLASALIDLSDGLSTDLAHLCDSSEVGADVWAERLPRPKDLTREERLALDPLDLALHGGEDYELLFTVSKRNLARLERRRFGVPVHRIGEISRAKRMKLILPRGQATGLKPFGYDQFVRTFKKAY